MKRTFLIIFLFTISISINNSQPYWVSENNISILSNILHNQEIIIIYANINKNKYLNIRFFESKDKHIYNYQINYYDIKSMIFTIRIHDDRIYSLYHELTMDDYKIDYTDFIKNLKVPIQNSNYIVK